MKYCLHEKLAFKFKALEKKKVKLPTFGARNIAIKFYWKFPVFSLARPYLLFSQLIFGDFEI